MPPRNSVMDRVLSGVGNVEIQRRDYVGRPAMPGEGEGPAAQYTPSSPYKHQYMIDLGFTSTAAVLPGADVAINIHPVTPFAPYELQIPSDIAYDFALVSMQLQDRSFVDGDPVNCSKFSEVASPVPLEIGTIDTQDTLRCVFRNTGVAAQVLVGSFRGSKLSR
jgi:hypothetical protein